MDETARKVTARVLEWLDTSREVPFGVGLDKHSAPRWQIIAAIVGHTAGKALAEKRP